MIVNLPKMLHDALLRGQTGSKKVMDHARALSAKANASDSDQDHLASIRGFQMATETQGSYAAAVAHVMSTIQAQGEGPNTDMDEDCGNDNCPVHGGNKPN